LKLKPISKLDQIILQHIDSDQELIWHKLKSMEEWLLTFIY